jgi:hypothetical protein
MLWDNQLKQMAAGYQARNQQAKAQEQQAAVQQQQAIQSAAAQAKAVSKGYKLIPNFDDLLLDSKVLAAKNTKIQITGYYKKNGDTERLYASTVDAYQGNDKFIPVTTDNAVRSLREHLLTQCTGIMPGCQIAVGGHMQMCHYLNPVLANYPPIACLNIGVSLDSSASVDALPDESVPAPTRTSVATPRTSVATPPRPAQSQTAAPAAVNAAKAYLAVFRATQASRSSSCVSMATDLSKTLTGSIAATLAKSAAACSEAVFDEIDPTGEKFDLTGEKMGPDFQKATHYAMFPMMVQLNVCAWLQKHSPSRYLAAGRYCNPGGN